MENVNNNNENVKTPVDMSEEEILNFESNQKEQKEDVASELDVTSGLSEEALVKYKEVLMKLEKETDKHKAASNLVSNVVAGAGTGLIMSGIVKFVYNTLKR